MLKDTKSKHRMCQDPTAIIFTFFDVKMILAPACRHLQGRSGDEAGQTGGEVLSLPLPHGPRDMLFHFPPLPI